MSFSCYMTFYCTLLSLGLQFNLAFGLAHAHPAGSVCKPASMSPQHMCAVQVKYPENFFLLRGNHECASINRIYGFYDECKRRYNIRLWKTFTDCFNCLPVAALVDEKVCVCSVSSCFSCQGPFTASCDSHSTTSLIRSMWMNAFTMLAIGDLKCIAAVSIC